MPLFKPKVTTTHRVLVEIQRHDMRTKVELGSIPTKDLPNVLILMEQAVRSMKE